MTIGVIVITVGILGWFTWIFFEPSTPLNPLPVPTMPVLAVPPTRTPELSPTPTQTPTPEPTVTPTVTPTATPQPTIVAATPVTTPPTLTPTDAYSNYPFVVYGEITSIEAALMHPAEGCNWQGIAGQVFNTKGAPILYTGVQIGGRFNGRQISRSSSPVTARITSSMAMNTSWPTSRWHPITPSGCAWWIRPTCRFRTRFI